MRGWMVLAAALILAQPAAAGQIVLANGNRLEAELAGETLVLATGSGVVEIAADQVATLTPEAVELTDGRTIQGAVVGGVFRARTARGELTITLDELAVFAARPAPSLAGPANPSDAPAPATAAVGPARPVGEASPGVAADRDRWVEALAESVLYRDAFAAAGRVGAVFRGQLLTYLDFIDRRLRVLNTLVFDGGHWIKVRASDGTEGWLPAGLLREVR